MNAIVKSILSFGWKWILKILKIVYDFLSTWHELWMIPMALALYFFIAPWIKSFDPQTKEYNLGYFLIPLMALVFLLIGSGVSWMLFKFSWPSLYRTHKQRMIDFVKKAPLWQVVGISVFLFCFYLYLFVRLLEQL